ncbi:hypothetical protein [Bariatricus massiliensis]|nr:hypothetical protein [Bariatricus massiliensis]MCB7306038.1 hypothetical protein [Bariatricus massiliensis]MCB7389181.1 hypothetical protein [Bariatricus massiliensis]MCB7413354.1 hypothetical protein [Bariatricus massiliensis]
MGRSPATEKLCFEVAGTAGIQRRVQGLKCVYTLKGLTELAWGEAPRPRSFASRWQARRKLFFRRELNNKWKGGVYGKEGEN